MRIYSRDKKSFVDYDLEAFDLGVIISDKDARFLKTGKQVGMANTP